MTTNHPAHGPVSLDRLHQIREILSKASTQSDGGNLGYAMADAVKVIDEVLGRRQADSAEPIYQWRERYEEGSLWDDCTKAQYDGFAKKTDCEVRILYTAPPAPVVNDELYKLANHVASSKNGLPEEWQDWAEELESEIRRAAMLQGKVDDEVGSWNNHKNTPTAQAGNSPATPDGWIPVSDRMPERDIDVQVFCADKKEQMVGYMERNETEGWFRFASLPNGGGVYCKPTHWMPLPAEPQQEVKP
ncbi:TPA: DUF551 domain-containing protein [Escherichia coli]